jgi:hypothetical protein
MMAVRGDYDCEDRDFTGQHSGQRLMLSRRWEALAEHSSALRAWVDQGDDLNCSFFLHNA